ncbi:hypothetical protein ACDQ55_11480 [Chitinophaga sp. 30R24]|uniref:hypothetical protein n=1 Tax=Chitinophaga sp. 30R24 TaxID=3248838 RepID=UPI003B8F415B
MEWQQLLADFFAGIFLANAVPHFVHGISGNKFPTVFSKPRGVGLSSPTTNVLWALFNLMIGYVLAKRGHVSSEEPATIVTLFIGIAAISLLLSKRFQKKHKEE